MNVGRLSIATALLIASSCPMRDGVAPRSIENAETQARLSRECLLECADAGGASGFARFQTKFADR
ncbi:hypothetical protein AOQ71_33205 [Bradyrhizobium manausense]|uniref:Uncharacterized protein n=1 Tax=Bradyrhizobium manausense TaxID=989370 RepID=A0A0R3D7F3_9BRAD|nr:hypothetical protein AOQ71_33205 [Bradyrhizobium manausense]